jgi:hypothetical protein
MAIYFAIFGLPFAKHPLDASFSVLTTFGISGRTLHTGRAITVQTLGEVLPALEIHKRV